MTQVIDFIGGEYRNRTGVHGFAIRCVTTPPTRLGLWWGPSTGVLWLLQDRDGGRGEGRRVGPVKRRLMRN